MVQGVDLSGVETVSKYKQQLQEAKDVLEIYDDKMRQTQKSFFNKPPSTHGSSYENFNNIAQQSFYDGNGRYSQVTHEFADYYLQHKPEYDSRRIDVFEEAPHPNTHLGGYENDFYSQTNRAQASHMTQLSQQMNNPAHTHFMSKSMSVKDLNQRIKQTIDTNRRSRFM